VIRRLRGAVAVCALVAPARVTAAQSVRAADSLLAAGAWQRAESVYYAAASARPRDPVVRAALARYLAERGATRVAATLFEEALQFGSDPFLIAPHLAPLYLAIGNYQALLDLRGARLGAGERERARWLVRHPTRVVAPDTALMAAYHADVPGSPYLGRVLMRIDGLSVDARVSARASGIVIADSSAVARRLRRFATDTARAGGGGLVVRAVADSIAFGRLAIMNVPVDVGALDAPAVVGLAFLGRFGPTFDAHAQRVTLRSSGSVAAVRGQTALPTLLTESDFQILRGGGWLSVADQRIEQMLNGRRWTVDAKRGLLRVE
jgi:hypothetical protein